MMTPAINIAATFLYLAASAYVLIALLKKTSVNKEVLIGVSIAALVAHGFGVGSQLFTEHGYNLGFFVALSLITWVVNLLVLVSGLRLPLHNLFVLLFPLSAAIVVATIAAHQPLKANTSLTPGMISHILLSILAYSLLTIAAFQSLLLAWQNHQLRNKHTMGRVRLLPPLQTMETLLFDMLWAGQLFLTISIVSGFLYLEDMFGQSLAHKTILSLFAWCLYSILLWGRHWLGWRGNSAIRWTLAGFCTLMVAYFGSKLVLEIILGR
ncbi:inner membrane protein YpjD [Marinibactrum halimedae]|uniref:Inner membrane protein YpjD n=1 Tax=Marinibactrum halimedae TaxID=1444977 RepID=A0AA37T3P8_9GAMM|nr:cytochrome c biogenesis protein CcsA [Marinibactrum halimedae]MCD9460061.1 cytochrome c biogenesis protein CcsA [Marinibactrum halimedae]GLS26459.1 inner membrane protein YpjD [Marinibactrum halimedae]